MVDRHWTVTSTQKVRDGGWVRLRHHTWRREFFGRQRKEHDELPEAVLQEEDAACTAVFA